MFGPNIMSVLKANNSQQLFLGNFSYEIGRKEN